MADQNQKVYEEVDDDWEPKQVANEEVHQYKEEYAEQSAQTYHESESRFVKQEKTEYAEEAQIKGGIDHISMGKYANDTFQTIQEGQGDVKISITGNQTRGNALSKYIVYIIRGEDRNGQINIVRRFKQFFEMRVAMMKRWPGCFVPSIPPRNALHKNDPTVIIQRQRYLNQFIKKVAKLPYLYYGQEFQALIRSKENDITSMFEKWPTPTAESIISKYRQSFSELNGKQINAATNEQIANFYGFIRKNQPILEKYALMAKNLALARDRLDKSYKVLFSQSFINYEKTCLFEFAEGRQQEMLYANPSEAKLVEHEAIVGEAMKKNPYWLLYDMITNEQRDGKAFLEALNYRETVEVKKNTIEGRIRDNERTIMDINMGKKNITTITTKGTNEEIKYKLEVENQQLKKEKESLLVLSDIVAALIVYIEIAKFKRVKAGFYDTFLRRLGGYEISMVQNLGEVWAGLHNSLKNRL